MDENERIAELKRRLANNEQLNRLDWEYLFSLLSDKDKKIELLEKKTKILLQQSMELTEEMENVRKDFGDMR